MVTIGEDPLGPQNWYKEAGGQPAQALPKEDVGPHLPPGGETPTPGPCHPMFTHQLVACIRPYILT